MSTSQDNERMMSTLLLAHPTLLRNLNTQKVVCGDGWLDLLSKLLADIDALCKLDRSQGVVFEPEIDETITRVGGLRVYGDFGEDKEKYMKLIYAACEQSLALCERCGATGRQMHMTRCNSERHSAPWHRRIRTLCTSHEFGYKPIRQLEEAVP